MRDNILKMYHNNARQFFSILSGTATLEVDGVFIELSALQGYEVSQIVPPQMLKNTKFIVTSQPNSKRDMVLTKNKNG
ncbi:hypothetical protein AB3U99_10730 [Niallia sp. JL1B1071]|uniref:hypothetical protein n=1 Tax=Niallia tiangongensis TaxID=3237105 RepID=UPI0037DC9692